MFLRYPIPSWLAKEKLQEEIDRILEDVSLIEAQEKEAHQRTLTQGS